MLALEASRRRDRQRSLEHGLLRPVTLHQAEDGYTRCAIETCQLFSVEILLFGENRLQCSEHDGMTTDTDCLALSIFSTARTNGQ